MYKLLVYTSRNFSGRKDRTYAPEIILGVQLNTKNW